MTLTPPVMPKMHGGTNAKRHRMLCKDCRNRYQRAYKKGVPVEKRPTFGRFTLARHPDKYKRASATNCPHCGGSNIKSVEAQRRREYAKKDICYCNPIPFPHENKSIMGCINHPKPYDEWTDEDHEQYQAMLETPRSG